MKFRKSDFMIAICVILICVNNIVLAKSKVRSKKYDMNLDVARPVIEIIKDEPIKCQIYQNSFPIEYNFCINNYDANSTNEVEFDYFIEIESSDENFPISYVLFDCDNNKELQLCNGKSEILRLKANKKQSRKFKLILEWQEKTEELAEKLQLNLKVTAVQSKEGSKNENV